MNNTKVSNSVLTVIVISAILSFVFLGDSLYRYFESLRLYSDSVFEYEQLIFTYSQRDLILNLMSFFVMIMICVMIMSSRKQWAVGIISVYLLLNIVNMYIYYSYHTDLGGMFSEITPFQTMKLVFQANLPSLVARSLLLVLYILHDKIDSKYILSIAGIGILYLLFDTFEYYANINYDFLARYQLLTRACGSLFFCTLVLIPAILSVQTKAVRTKQDYAQE